MLMLQGRIIFIVVSLFSIIAHADGDITHKKIVKDGIVFLYSDNFFVSYKEGDSTDEYVKKVLLYLEISRKKMINEWGFAKSSYLESYRTQVEVKIKFDFGNVYEGYSQHPRMELKQNMSELDLKSTCAHEFFHVIQSTFPKFFGSDKNRWFEEASATSIENEVFPDVWGYQVFLSKTWYLLWGHGRSLTYTNNNFHYGSAIFIKYLMQKFEGILFLKKIFDKIEQNQNQDSVMAINSALPRLSKFEDVFADFAAWVFIQGHEKEPNSYNFDPMFLPKGFHFLIKSDESILPYKITHSDPLSARYFEIKSPDELKFIEKLVVSVQGQAGIKFRVISWDVNGSHSISTIMTPTKKSYETLAQIPNFGKLSTNITTKAIVVISNTNSEKTADADLRFTIGEPNYLQAISILTVKDIKELYHARWIDSYNNTRELKVDTNNSYTVSLGSLTVRAVFSNSVLEAPIVKIGAHFVKDLKKIDGKVWEGTLEAFDSKESSLPILVQANDYKEDPLDTKPQTIAKFDGFKITNYEYDRQDENIYDQNHKLILKTLPSKYSFRTYPPQEDRACNYHNFHTEEFIITNVPELHTNKNGESRALELANMKNEDYDWRKGIFTPASGTPNLWVKTQDRHLAIVGNFRIAYGRLNADLVTANPGDTAWSDATRIKETIGSLHFEAKTSFTCMEKDKKTKECVKTKFTESCLPKKLDVVYITGEGKAMNDGAKFTQKDLGVSEDYPHGYFEVVFGVGLQTIGADAFIFIDENKKSHSPRFLEKTQPTGHFPAFEAPFNLKPNKTYTVRVLGEKLHVNYPIPLAPERFSNWRDSGRFKKINFNDHEFTFTTADKDTFYDVIKPSP